MSALRLMVSALAVALLTACGMEDEYQRDMDRVRITHVDFVRDLVVEFRNRVGRFPLADRLGTNRIEVFITHRELDPEILQQVARLPVDLVVSEVLRAELEKHLGRPIGLPSDPQNAATYAPNFYIYEVNPQRACIAGHLYFQSSEARPVSGHRYFKYEHCVPA